MHFLSLVYCYIQEVLRLFQSDEALTDREFTNYLCVRSASELLHGYIKKR